MDKWLNKFGKGSSSILLLAAVLILLNGVASFLYLRWDITQEKLFTLSEGSEKVLGKIEGELTIKLFRSKSLAETPIAIQNYSQRVEEILREYEDKGGNNVILEVLDPKPDDEVEEWALKFGLQGVPLQSGNSLFLGAVFIYGGEEKIIPFFDPSREKYLEYDITQNLSLILNPGKKKIGIISSLNVVSQMDGMPPVRGMKMPESWLFIQELKKSFKVERIEVNTKTIDKGIDLLMVFHPKKFSESTLYAIDQYLMAGGRLMVFVDPFSRTDQQLSKSPQQQGQMPNLSSDLNRLLKTYGATTAANKVVGDLDLALKVNAGPSGVMRYPVWMALNKESMNKDMLVTGQLDSMMVMEAGSIVNEKVAGVEFTPLIQTTESAGTVESFLLQFGGPEAIKKQLKKSGKKEVLAALLKGKFKSAFATGAPKDADTKSPHLSAAKAENTIFIMSDVDFIYDSNAVKKMNFFGQSLIQPINDNLNFMSNTLEFLSGDDSLISIRSRGTFSRPFTRVQNLQKKAQEKWQKEEDTLSAKVQEIQERLNKLQTKREGGKIVLSQEQVKEIENARKEMGKTKKARREVRKHLREDIEALGNNLMLANLLVVPGFLGLLALFRMRRRQD